MDVILCNKRREPYAVVYCKGAVLIRGVVPLFTVGEVGSSANLRATVLFIPAVGLAALHVTRLHACGLKDDR